MKQQTDPAAGPQTPFERFRRLASKVVKARREAPKEDLKQPKPVNAAPGEAASVR